jgi:menaquinone-specific isochorismate synthase
VSESLSLPGGLHVTTSPVDDPVSLLDRLPRTDPLLWVRRAEGIVGFGTARRLEFSGPGRFADAAAAWRELAAAAKVRDTVGLPGSGLVAFGAFAFGDRSAARSVLVVPEVVLGRRQGRAWMTRISSRGRAPGATDPATSAPPAETLGAGPQLSFSAGSLDPQGYLAAVAEAVGRIRAGGLSKAVLARDLVAQAESDADLRAVLADLATGYPDCWTFAVDGFLGSSPETLVSVHDGSVSARVLAGSAARGTDAATDQAASVALVTSEKDQDEHEFAVQSVLAALRPHGRAIAASEVPFALRLPNLWHLASDVDGVLDDGSSALDLVGALHPTAAVAGTPTPDALALIEELEPFDRGRYAGPVGWIGADGDGEWAIGLRCAQLEEDGAVRAFAGAGIVAESVAEHELAETTMKFRPVVEAFGA